VRRGNTFSVFHLDSWNPDAMTQMTEQTVNLPSTVYLGFAVMGNRRQRESGPLLLQVFDPGAKIKLAGASR
jgi:hypothetical protein